MSTVCLSPHINLCNIALNIQFNAAVLTICNRVLPSGYDVADDAPNTYEELINYLDAGRRMLVYSGGAEPGLARLVPLARPARLLACWRERDVRDAGQTPCCPLW